MYAAMDDIAGQFPEEDVLITSHGLALATVICKVKGMNIGQAYSVIPENAEPVWVTWPVPGG
jgi:broad specificity phosphatase PhoE